MGLRSSKPKPEPVQDQQTETRKREPVVEQDENVNKKSKIKEVEQEAVSESIDVCSVAAPQVLFTGISPSPEMRTEIERLGGTVVNSVEMATHLVTDKLRRTLKLLCCVNRGVPVLSIEWLYTSFRSSKFVDEKSFILDDEEMRSITGTTMSEALKRAKAKPLYEGLKFYITPHCCVPIEELSEIIKFGGGKVLSKLPNSLNNVYIVTSLDPNDADTTDALLAKNITLYNPDLVLTSSIKQSFEPESIDVQHAT